MKLPTAKSIRIYWLRLRIALRLATKEKHFFVVTITEKQLELLLRGKPMGDINAAYVGMMDFHIFQIMKEVADNTCSIDVALSKAEFEAAVQEKMEANKKNNFAD